MYAAVCGGIVVRKCDGNWTGFVGENKKEECKKDAPSFSVLSSASLDLSAGGWIRMRRGAKGKLEGSYTVEASLVMAIILFFLAALLQGMFLVHGRVVGRFVLQDALERSMCLEESEDREENLTAEKVEQQAVERLRGFFWCGNAEVRLNYHGVCWGGTVDTGVGTEIVVTEFDPEKQLRLLTAIGL